MEAAGEVWCRFEPEVDQWWYVDVATVASGVGYVPPTERSPSAIGSDGAEDRLVANVPAALPVDWKQPEVQREWVWEKSQASSDGSWSSTARHSNSNTGLPVGLASRDRADVGES